MTLFEAMMKGAPVDPLDRFEYEKKVRKDIEALGLEAETTVGYVATAKLPMVLGPDGLLPDDGGEKSRMLDGKLVEVGEAVRIVSNL